MPVPTPVLAEMRAYLGYATSEDAQMPDPLDHADLRWLAGLSEAHGNLILPELEHAYFANPVGSPWGARKKDRSLRWMATMNPAAELRARIALHPHSEALHAAQTDHAISNSYDLKRDLASGVSVLKRRPFGQTHGRLRRRLAMLRQQGHRHGFKTDISSFYPSVRPATVAAAVACRTDRETATELGLLAQRFELETGQCGLPIGAEFSSLLSNLALAPVDDAMDDIPNIEWDRWTDDFLVLDGAPQIVDRARQRLSDVLDLHGLHLSTAKTISTTDPGSACTVEDLIGQFAGSQGDLQGLKRSGTPKIETVELAEFALLSELENARRDTSRINRLAGYLAWAPSDMQRWKHHIAASLLDNHQIWETSVPRPVGYLAHSATPTHWLDLIELARELVDDQPVTDEQVAQIACAVARHARSFETPATAGELMFAIFRVAESAIVKGWALQATARLAPERVLPLIFDAQGFDFLSPLEQRWALGLAVLPDHKAFLEEQARSGRWRLTARWRLAACG